MAEMWKPIPKFRGYSISDQGQVRSDKSGRILAQFENGYNLACVAMMQEGERRSRSVPLLVANAFIPRPSLETFDTPINLNGDRWDNRVENLMWRPRWFAVKYNRQSSPWEYGIPVPMEDRFTGEVSANSFECAKRYGLLENDLVISTLNYQPVWPTYQEFRIL